MPGRFLLVGWEIGDARCLHPLIDSGELPTLARLLEGGVGGTLTAPRPLVDTALWTSLATGKRAWQHGALTPSRASPSESHSSPEIAAPLRASALWDILGQVSLPSLVVGWPAICGSGRHPGATVSEGYSIPTAPPGRSWPPAAPGIYEPPDLAKSLDPCRIRPDQIGADALAEFVPDWQTVDQSQDRRLAHLRILLAADLSSLAALTALMSSRAWTLAAVRFRSIAEIWRLFGADHLADTGPYRNVVRAAYGLLDRMLETLIAESGPDVGVAVVTAGGVEIQPGRRTLSPSSHGFFVLSGPGFVTDALVHGAGALDIAPTLLQWFALPAAQGTEGRILWECLSSPEEVPARATMGSGAPAPMEAPPPSDATALWNYACSCLDGSRLDLALSALERLFVSFPENPTFTEALFKTQLALGMCDEADQSLSFLKEICGPTPGIRISEAEMAMVRKQTSLAREIVRAILATGSLSVGLWRRVGLLLAGLRDWEGLEKLARQLIQQNDGDEIAWLGLAEASLRLGNLRTASAAAREAIRRRFFFPEAHLALARALARDGMPLAAIEATERLLRIQPGNPAAHRYLRRLRLSLAVPHSESAN